MLLSVAIFVFLAASATRGQDITTCKYDEKICGCKTDNGYISLKKYTSQPFSDQDPISSFTYFWSPCKDITKGAITSSCLQVVSDSIRFDCGTHKSITTTVKDGHATFHLDSGEAVPDRHSEIVCVCKTNGVDTFEFVQEDPSIAGLYDLKLTGDICCEKTGPPPTSDSSGGGLSIGSILLIVVLVVVIVYLVAGMVVQTAVRKAEGKERIPNISFWSLMPGLIRDGFRFTFSCGKSTKYDEI